MERLERWDYFSGRRTEENIKLSSWASFDNTWHPACLPGFCPGDHSQPMLRFLRFFPANGDLVLEIFPGFRPVRFHVVCADTGGGSYYLSDKWIIDGILREGFCGLNDCFTKSCSTLFEVTLLFVIGILSFVCHLSFGL